ncbi:type II secretion system protein [Moritella sp.]|uniref:type II secretion system protein n=1 Tax=Moritella sp. TaxID=78556 RepID=UPI001DB1A733|nr:type II secretion system protein [Moritella sp.]MCJ8349800.1 type II secretion system GspH family protein [Moritella sp.]NQZ39973.1 type II secretion system protein [Moritella sp.]
MFKKSGFTLIELVIVIILLGILAATAIPKFIGKDDFEGQVYRDQLLQLLKTVQQQAMSCDEDCRENVGGTARSDNPYACNKVIIKSDRFGIPANCNDTDLPDNFNPPQLGISQTEADSSAIRFSPHTIEFDPLGVASSCASCDISIIGEQTLLIRIESQGYIHEQ